MDQPLLTPGLLILGLMVVGLAPFAAVMTTSFVKIVVVLQILRNALGLQQAPPNMAINGLAIVLTFYVMAPVGFQIKDIFIKKGVTVDNIGSPAVYDALSDSIEPYREFLKKHSNQGEREFFVETTKELWPKPYSDNVEQDHIMVLVPSFLLSQLKTAFQIGFLLFLPFLVIDLVVSNILLAMGMMMVQPTTISLPLKILLFVLVDGWTLLIHGLVLSYV